jgi:hypothetical protein
MAAAIAGRADIIVTADEGDYPRPDLALHSIRVLSPDEYLVELLREVPDEVLEAVRRMSVRRKRPPMTVGDVVGRLGNAGAKDFAARLHDLLAAESPA